MTIRENVRAILNYEPADHLPVIHFGFWWETLEKWKAEGHLSSSDIEGFMDGNEVDVALQKKLGFDYNWQTMIFPTVGLNPVFESRVVEKHADGSQVVFSPAGVLLLQKPGVVSIPPEIGHTLVDRASWEQHYLPRLQWSADRVPTAALLAAKSADNARETPLGLHVGSMIGTIRDWLGVEELSYLPADDPDLFREIVDTVGELSYRAAEACLQIYDGFDYLHFWEDICFKNGPLVTPSLFEQLVGPHYQRMSDLAARHGIRIISVDCDGWIDHLIPTWIEHGVNTMFPMEVGTWDASIQPWRETYGKRIRGVGGMNKTVFAYDHDAIDAEIERLRPLIELGGYIPCPDHRIPPDAKYENVRYYCEKMQSLRL